MQLAVVAHIRHTYTNYDKLLKGGDWHAARAQVEQLTLDKLLTWRRDDDDDPNAMDGILREVIVIPDDDEENDSHEINFTGSTQADREDSVEIVSNHAVADELQTRPIEYDTIEFDTDPNGPSSLEIATRDPVRYVHREPLHYQQQNQGGQERLDRIGDYRHRVWEQALHRRRKDPEPLYPMAHHPNSPAAARSNQIGLLQNQAEHPTQRSIGTPRQPHLIQYVGKAPAREQLHYGALPRNDKHAEIRCITDHNRESLREIEYTPGQVSQVDAHNKLMRIAFAQLTFRTPSFTPLRICRYIIHYSNQQALLDSRQAVRRMPSTVGYTTQNLHYTPVVNKSSQGCYMLQKTKK